MFVEYEVNCEIQIILLLMQFSFRSNLYRERESFFFQNKRIQPCDPNNSFSQTSTIFRQAKLCFKSSSTFKEKDFVIEKCLFSLRKIQKGRTLLMIYPNQKKEIKFNFVC